VTRMNETGQATQGRGEFDPLNRLNWSKRKGLRIRRIWSQSPLVIVGGLILTLIVFASLFAPFLTPNDPLSTSFGNRLAEPAGLGGSLENPLGTDSLGRDIYSRLLHGGRLSLGLTVSGVIVGGIVGVFLGLLSGYVGGRTDSLIMRIADVQLAFPIILLAIAIIAVVGTSLQAIVGVLAISGWVFYARTVRSTVLSIREREYIEAAIGMGASPTRVILFHVLPNTWAPILVIASSQFATLVLLESGLSFLGLGVQPPDPSWGNMLAEGRDYLSNAWWLATHPGIVISLTVLGANLLGDGLRDLLDPRLRQR
jgi:peptide/nickel transport system permease protein